MIFVGYGFVFRYFLGGKYVVYVEGSRSLYEGDFEFISMDLYKGCGKRFEKGFRIMEIGFFYEERVSESRDEGMVERV